MVLRLWLQSPVPLIGFGEIGDFCWTVPLVRLS
jgi:hypothetical protein